MRLHLLASLVLAPSLFACASSGVVTPTTVALEIPEPTPTTVFLETAGMDLTPPSSCDYTVASAVLESAVYGERESVRPACEQACRVDTCRSMAVQGEVMGAMYYDDFDHALPEMIAQCEQTADSCVAVTGVVMLGESLDTLGFDVPEYPVDVEVEEAPVLAKVPNPTSEAACQNGDAAACYDLVDLQAVLAGWEAWQQPVRDISLRHWQHACDLEPMIYCRGLDLAISYTTDTGCSG